MSIAPLHVLFSSEVSVHTWIDVALAVVNALQACWIGYLHARYRNGGNG